MFVEIGIPLDECPSSSSHVSAKVGTFGEFDERVVPFDGRVSEKTSLRLLNKLSVNANRACYYRDSRSHVL